MAVTIVATVGASNANSFVTLAEADSFMESRLNASSWETDASTDDQNRALVEATRWLSALFWIGRRTTDTQALSWPRDFAFDPDSPTNQFFSNTVIPTDVKDATSELAFQFIKSGTTDIAALDPNRQVKRKKVDVLETEFVDSFAKVKNLDLYPSVTRLIEVLLVGRHSLNVPTVRG